MRGIRAGIVHPLSDFGRAVRERLDEEALPVVELKLFEEADRGASTLTEFQEEVLVTQPLDADLFPRLDVLFVAPDAPESSKRLAARAADEGVLTIVAGPDEDEETPVVVAGLNDAELGPDTRRVVSPDASEHLLGLLLGRIAARARVELAVATCLVPASSRGASGVEELEQQVVRLLRFEPPPTEVLAGQLAFNLRPRAAEDGAELRAGARVRRIAGLETEPAVRLVEAPLFHAYAASLWLRTTPRASVDLLHEALADEARVRLVDPEDPAPTPVDVGESEAVFVQPTPAPAEGCWVWAVADGRALDAATNAVALAARLLGIERSRA